MGRLRTLALVTPYLDGPDVARVQRALGVPDDGLYGPVTASAAAWWKRGFGYPDESVSNVLGPTDQRYLLGREEAPPDYAARARERAAALELAALLPGLAVGEMEAWAAAGLVERPPGSDRVPRLVRLAGQLGVADPYRRMGFPWCAFAAFLAALRHGGATARAGLVGTELNALYCPTVLAEAQNGRFGLRVIAPSLARRGDLVLFDWGPGGDPADHLGRLVAPPASGTVATVDGNTEGRVALRERPQARVRAFVRDS